MKRLLVILLLLLSFSAIATNVSAQQPRLANCDRCGYCPPNPVPQSWEACRACLYPATGSEPATSNKTIEINEDMVAPPTPMPGRLYTIMGCIKTDKEDFTQEGGAQGLIQFLLDRIFGVVGGIALLYFIYGAFLMMTSQSSPERLSHGKRVLYGAIIGLIFTLLSVFIVNIIASGILKIPGFQ